MSWFSKFAGNIVGGALGFLGGHEANKQQASQFAQITSLLMISSTSNIKSKLRI